jgi:hypothetical protein
MYSYAGTINVLVFSDVARVRFEPEAEGSRFLRNHNCFIHVVKCQNSRHINAHLLANTKYKFIKYHGTRALCALV